MPATPAITPPSDMIAVKTTPASPPARTGDAFGQVLRSVRDAAPNSAAAPNNDTPELPASELATSPVAEANADQAAGVTMTVATPAVEVPARAIPAGAPPSDKPKTASIAASSDKPRHTRKQDSQATVPQSVDPTAATPAPSSRPAPATGAPIQNLVGVAAPAPQDAMPVAAGAGSGIPAAAAATARLGTPAAPPAAPAPRRTAPAAGPAAAASERDPSTAAPATPAAALNPAEPDPAASIQAASVPAILAVAGNPPDHGRTTQLLPSQQTAATITTGLVAPAADSKLTLHPANAAADPTQPAAVPGTLLDQAVPTFTPTAVPTPITVVTTPHTHAASPATAEQVAPALLTLAKTTDGSQQMTVRLQPAELGMVQVLIARAASGETRIEITAEKAGTLSALQQDQPQLHRTLDEAGIPAAGRSMTFHVAQPAQTSASSNGSGSGTSQQGSANRGTAGDANAGGSAGGGGRGSYRARGSNSYSSGRRPIGSLESANANRVTATTSYRIGLDITA